MKYTVRKSIIWIVGRIWMPPIVCSQERVLSTYDIENMRDDDGHITRDSVEQWLCGNSGDFQEVIDFSASIEDGDNTVNIQWATEDGEIAYYDSMSEE